MTTVLDADERLAWIAMRGGPVVCWTRLPGGYRSTLSGDGLSEWTASATDVTSKSLSISKHVDGERRRILEISPPREETSEVPIRWNSTLLVGKGRNVRATGTAGDFSAAHAACESYEHESRQIGGTTWWRESEDTWVSWMGTFALPAVKISPAVQEAYWHFQTRGDVASFEEAAMLAMMGRVVVDSPPDGEGA